MAKGLAVVSGSNTVVFKALENGVVKMGGLRPDGTDLSAVVTISGSLELSGSEGINLKVSGSEFTIDNLSGLGDRVVISGSSLTQAVDANGNALPDQRDGVDADKRSTVRDEKYQLRGGLLWSATSSIHPDMMEDPSVDGYYDNIATLDNTYELPEDFVVVTSEGELRRINKIDASAVVTNDGENVEQKIGNLELEITLSQSTDIDVYSVDKKDLNLNRGSLNFKDIEHRTHVTTADVDDGESVEVTIDLDPELRVETLSASMGLEVTGSSNLRGKVHVVGAESDLEVDRDLDVHGSATVDGNVTIKGDLNVWGDTSVTTADSKHLQIEDAVVHIGRSLASGSEDPATGGVDGADGIADLGFVFGDSNKRALVLKSGDLYLGKTDDNASSTTIDVDYESAGNVTLYVPNLSASADVQTNTLSVLSDADVGGTLDVVGATTLRNTLDVTGRASFQDDVDVTGSLTVNTDADIKGNLNVDGTGSFGDDVTLRAGADLTLVQGNVVLSDGNLTVSGSTELSGTLTVQDGFKTLLGGELTVKGQVYLNSNAEITGSLIVKADADLRGNVTLGSNAADLVQVKGQFKAPVFTRADIPADYIQNAADYEGHMFYLKPDVANGEKLLLQEGDAGYPNFARGNKWYFNEDGTWHSSFFWEE